MNILLVEDQILIAMSERSELQKRGYTVHHVLNGESAVKSVCDNNIPIDIILMDIDLGLGIDGTQAANQILEIKDIPIVFLSSHTEPEIVEKTEKITSYGYIVKNSGIVVIDASIKMAMKLFRAKMENKEFSDDLIQKTTELEGFFATALDLLCVGDTEGNFKRVNPQWKEVLGYPLEEIQGRNYREFLYHDDKQATINAVSILLETKASMDYTNRFLCKDGTYRWIEWRSIQQGDLVYSSARDITEHKRVEDEMRSLKSFYADILDSVINGVWVTDKDDRIIYSNEGMMNIGGITPEKFLNYCILSDFPDENLKFFIPQYVKAKDTLSPVFYEEIPITTLAGKLTYQSGWLVPRINNGLFDGIICTSEDVTNNKQIQENLRLSEEKFSKVFLLNPAIMSISTIEEGKFIDVNNAFLETFGYAKDEVVGKTSEDIAIFTDNNQRAQIVDELKANGFVQQIEVAGMTKNGTARYGLFSAYPLEIQGKKYLLSVTNDITERKKAETKLKDQKDRLDSILQGTNAGTWEWNVQTGETIFNERWAEIIGYSLEEISPVTIDTWVKFCHPDDIKESERLLQSCFDGKAEFYIFECRMKHKDGRWVWVHDRGKIISRTIDGRPEWMYGTHQDISERK